jgi:hypothetical protein
MTGGSKGQGMQRFEYKVVSAPRRPKKFKGVKGTGNQFAEVLAEVMNEMAAGGWEFQRAETLPVDEKPGMLKSRVEVFHSVLVFRRPSTASVDARPETDTPATAAPMIVPVLTPDASTAPEITLPDIASPPVTAPAPEVAAPAPAANAPEDEAPKAPDVRPPADGPFGAEEEDGDTESDFFVDAIEQLKRQKEAGN